MIVEELIDLLSKPRTVKGDEMIASLERFSLGTPIAGTVNPATVLALTVKGIVNGEVVLE